MNALKQTTDRFSLFKDGRNIGANKRKYIVSAVRQMIESPRTQELIRLGEAYGYYGHQPRQRANKLSLGETEVIMIGGRPVVVDNVPSNVTLDISVSDDGIVTHTQEFLDTPTGKIALALHNSRKGGWSWATGGQDTPQAAITTSYHGMDYVLQPNFISLDHPSMMMESVEQGESLILESLQEVGFDADSASNILKSVGTQNSFDAGHELETQVMYLEGLNAELKQQADLHSLSSQMMLEAISAMPFYITDEQKAALANMRTPHDMKVVKAMFESLGSSKLSTLPTGSFEPSFVSSVPVSEGEKLKGQMIDLGGAGRRFS